MSVETSEQVEFLRHTKCRFLKGYFYEKAMPLAGVSRRFIRKAMVHSNKSRANQETLVTNCARL